jgi:hypothetical protein
VAKIFKGLKCIGAHFGGYSEWESVSCYRDTPNVYFDTSSSLSFITKEKARGLIEELGEDRFLFGTDFPMWRHEKELKKFMDIDLTDSQREKILHINAENFYGLNQR